MLMIFLVLDSTLNLIIFCPTEFIIEKLIGSLPEFIKFNLLFAGLGPIDSLSLILFLLTLLIIPAVSSILEQTVLVILGSSNKPSACDRYIRAVLQISCPTFKVPGRVCIV